MAIQSLAASSFLVPRKYNSMLVGNAAFDPSSDFLISEQVLASATGTITFSSIPADYKHLQLRIVAKTTNTVNAVEQIRLQFNGATTAVYASHRLRGTGSAVNSTATTGAGGTQIYAGYSPRGDVTQNFAASIVDILDYANTSKNTTVRTLAGYTNSASSTYEIGLQSGVWLDTSAVTSLTLVDGGGYTFLAGSRFSLYGSKG